MDRASLDRARLARIAAPVAVFTLVLGTLVLVQRGSRGGHVPRPVPVAVRAGARSGEAAAAPRDAATGVFTYTPVTIPDSLLAGLPTSGPTYRFGRADTAGVAALAKALGIAGEVRTEPGGWTVGPDGGRGLHVSDVAGLPWWVGEGKAYATDTVSSGTVSSGTAVTRPNAAPATASAAPPPDKPDVPPPTPGTDPGASTEPGTIEPAPPCLSPEPDTKVVCPGPVPVPLPAPSPPPQPTDAAARTAAGTVFAALGLDGATVHVQPGWLGKDVVASPVVGGLPTVGYDTRLTVDVHLDVVGGNGFLDTATIDDTYPLLDPKAALARTMTGGVAVDGREPMPLPAVASCLPEKPCTDLVAPPDRVATAVRLGLLYTPSYDATAAYLVPAWLLSFAGSDYPEPLMALPDRYLATPPPVTGKPDEPVCDPAPCAVDVPPDAGDSGSGSSDGSSGSGGAPTS